MNAITTAKHRPGDPALAAKLKRHTEGEVRFAPADRGRYATDASIYQVEPIGVLVPKTMADVEAALSLCREEGVPVLPRGAGTSQCGQTVNRALVIDCTKYLRNVLSVDTVAGVAKVQPGIALGALNDALKKDKLFFPVDPSTWARRDWIRLATSAGTSAPRLSAISPKVKRWPLGSSASMASTLSAINP
jgi:FAD/FMN-containing dehydrogenase